MASKARKPKTFPLIATGVIALVLVVILLLVTEPSSTLKYFLHAAALLGYSMIFLAALSSIYLRELVRWLGRPFIQTHHIIAVTGLAMITLHPILAAIDAADPGVLVPDLTSVSLFFQHAGRLGWYLLAVGSLAALFRKAIGQNWRYVHWLTYITFWLGTIHAILIGPSINNWPMRILFVLLALVLVYVLIKRRTPAKKPAKPRQGAPV